MARWSKLQTRVEAMFCADLELRIRFTVYRSKEGDEQPSAAIMSGKKVLWAYPAAKEQRATSDPNTARLITTVLDTWLDTASADLSPEPIENESLGLSEMLFVCDRRVGKRRLQRYLPELSTEAARIASIRLDM